MTLGEYLHQHNIRAEDFGHLIGLKSRSSIFRYLSGKRRPHKAIIDKITQATLGAVKASDFRPKCSVEREHRKRAASSAYLLRQMMNEPAEGLGPSPVMRKAMQILKDRIPLKQKKGGFYVDNRPISIKTLISQANAVLAEEGKPALFYPGVRPLISSITTGKQRIEV